MSDASSLSRSCSLSLRSSSSDWLPSGLRSSRLMAAPSLTTCWQMSTHLATTSACRPNRPFFSIAWSALSTNCAAASAILEAAGYRLARSAGMFSSSISVCTIQSVFDVMMSSP